MLMHSHPFAGDGPGGRGDHSHVADGRQDETVQGTSG